MAGHRYFLKQYKKPVTFQISVAIECIDVNSEYKHDGWSELPVSSFFQQYLSFFTNCFLGYFLYPLILESFEICHVLLPPDSLILHLTVIFSKPSFLIILAVCNKSFQFFAVLHSFSNFHCSHIICLRFYQFKTHL